MTALDLLLLLAAGNAVALLVLGRRDFAGWLATAGYAAQLLVLLAMGALGYGPGEIPSSLQFTVLGEQVGWRFDSMSWYFALITVGAALLASWYSAGDWGRSFRATGGNLRVLHIALALNVFTMLLLLGSGDLLSLFIGWELVSWASFLIMALGGEASVKAAYRYLIYAIGGAMAVLAGIGLLWAQAGTVQYAALGAAAADLSTPMLWLLVVLLVGGFGVKMALLPFHLWQAEAYARTPAPGASFLGAISSRMGLFGIMTMLAQIVSLGRLAELAIPFVAIDARQLIAWIAVLTIILPTYIALRQTDARMLLAWHGIGQGGYMLLGLMVADELGTAGGIMHVFNYGSNQAILFMSVFAVVYRTGTADLNKLGGLITRMPLSYVAMLVGIIGLAGIPPMNGFVSKWLIYRALIVDGSPLLFVGAVIGTLGTILSVYKLIHNTFLGQLRLEHYEVREAPWSMTLPMMVLAAIVFGTGYFPGIVLDWVASVQGAMGLPGLPHSLGGVQHISGGLDMIWIVSVLLVGIGIGAAIFYSGGRAKRVHQLDNYAGGHFLSADIRYQYSDNFYPGLMRLIGPLYRGSFRWAESALISALGLVSMAIQGFYRPAQGALYVLAVLVAALSWVLMS